MFKVPSADELREEDEHLHLSPPHGVGRTLRRGTPLHPLPDRPQERRGRGAGVHQQVLAVHHAALRQPGDCVRGGGGRGGGGGGRRHLKSCIMHKFDNSTAA